MVENNNVKRKILKDFPGDFKDFLEKPNSIYKNIIYNQNYRGIKYEKIDLYETPEKMCVGSNLFSLNRNKSSYYLKVTNKMGFTYDKKTKKIKIWFGANIIQLHDLILLFFKEKNIDWFINTQNLFGFLTKTGLERIISGKITNPIDFCRHYLKLNRVDASPRYLYYLIKNDSSFSKHQLFRAKESVINLDNYLKLRIKRSKLIQKHSNSKKPKKHEEQYELDKIDNQVNKIDRQIDLFHDLITQALMLEIKINANWCIKRIISEHDKLTKIIMDIEMENFKDEPINYDDSKISTLPKEIKLLKTKKEIYKEGKMMKHCIYTNYWYKIKYKQYVVFSVNYNNERATFGCNVIDNKIEFGSISGFQNANPSDSLRNWIIQWYDENKNNFFIKQPNIDGTVYIDQIPIENRLVNQIEVEDLF